MTGTHERVLSREKRQALFDLLDAAGVIRLPNECRLLEKGGASIVLAGVDDPNGPYDQKRPAQLVREIRQQYGKDAYILMLSHRNDELPLWAHMGVQTVLCGHGHGGIVRLPGIGAVFGYALYSIFGRCAIDRGYSSWTITFYTFVFCSLGCAPLTGWRLIAGTLAAQPRLIAWALAMALLTGFLAYILYTKGLEGMPSSRASILASVEPVTSAVIGTIVFHEPLSLTAVCGIVLVLGGIAVLSVRLPGKKREKTGQI